MKKLILTFLLFNVSAYSQVTIEQCEFESNHYIASRPNGEPGGISQQCKQLIFNKSELNAYRDYGEQDLIVYGHKNLFFAYIGENAQINRNVKMFPELPADIQIGGPNSNVEEIYALDVDFINSHIVALIKERDTKEKAIYTFRLWMSGSHVPMKKFKNSQIQTADNIRVDSVNQRIYVISGEEAKAIAYNTTTDDQNTNKVKFKQLEVDSLGKETKSFTNIKDISFSSDGQDLFVLDSLENKIYSYSSNGNKGRSPASEDVITSDITLQILEYDSKNQEVVGVTPQGKRMKLSKNDRGNNGKAKGKDQGNN